MAHQAHDGTTDPGRTMNNKKHLTAVATTAVLLALSGVAAGGAQAAPFEPGLPLSPLGQLPLSPASQQNAVRSAEDYIDMSGFSRQGLIKQLEYEDFSTEDATFAVDHITVDWNVQAARSAKDYLDMSGFSHSKLVAQLEYEGFTPAQAEYGTTAAGL
jgi:hypothetical protein